MRNFFRTLAPELFDAKVAIHTDGSYSFSYDGILIFVPALIQAGRGVIDARTEAQLGRSRRAIAPGRVSKSRLSRRGAVRVGNQIRTYL